MGFYEMFYLPMTDPYVWYIYIYANKTGVFVDGKCDTIEIWHTDPAPSWAMVEPMVEPTVEPGLVGGQGAEGCQSLGNRFSFQPPGLNEMSLENEPGTWWFIPRIVSGLVITPVISGLSLLIPFITRVVTHLLSGMSHQV